MDDLVKRNKEKLTYRRFAVQTCLQRQKKDGVDEDGFRSKTKAPSDGKNKINVLPMYKIL